jgi:fused signal recognition particle receptor
MYPRKYEALRDARRLADEQEQQRRDKAQQTREDHQPEKAIPEIDRDKIQLQARNEVALEQAKRYETQKLAYEQRQREEADKRERDAKRSEHMKANNPREYAIEEKYKQLRTDAAERDQATKREWAARGEGARQGQDERPGREQSDKTREKGDAAQAREGNKWRRELSDNARAAVEQARERDAQERERDRGR